MEVLLQHGLSAVEFGWTQLNADSLLLCLLFYDDVLVVVVKGWRAGADTMVWGWSCKELEWEMAWSEQQSVGLSLGGLAGGEREGPDEQGEVPTSPSTCTGHL